MKTDSQILARHYLIAALWADSPEGTNPRATRQAQHKAESIAWQFLEIVGPDAIAALEARSDYGAHPDCGNDRPHLAAAGHDLWLTSQGHGAGFWDRGLPDELSEQLCDAANRFNRIDPEFYRGWLYLHGTGPLSLERIES